MWAVLHHHHGGVHHHPDGDGNSPEAHNVGIDSQRVHDQEGHEDPDRQRYDGYEGGTNVQEEDDADGRHDGHLLDELGLQRVDGPPDEIGAVVALKDLHAFRQAFLQRPQLLLDVVNDVQGVFAVPHHNDAADRFPRAVPLQNTAPQFWAQLDGGDVPQQHWRAHVVHGHDDLLQIFAGTDVAQAAHHELGLAHLDQLAADVIVRALDGAPDLLDRQAVGQ